MTAIHSFNDATAVKALSSHTYSAHLQPDWCIGSVPHGGYVTALFLRVAQLHFSTTLSRQNQPHCLTLHLEFIRRTSVGPALFTVRDVKLGRQTSTIHVSISQPPSPSSSSSEEVLGYITHSNLTAETGVTFPTSWSLTHPTPAPVDLRLLASNADPHWGRQSQVPFAEFRKAARRTRWYLPRDTATQRVGVRDVWMQLDTQIEGGGGQERWTNAGLGFVADMFPQLVETFTVPDLYAPDGSRGSGGAGEQQRGKGKDAHARFWYPTLLLNLDVKKALPVEGVEWLFLRVQTKMVNKGRYDLEVVVMDETGDVVCLSHHVCFALSAERNLKERSTEKSVVKL